MAKIRCAIVGLGRIGSLLEEDRLREKPCTHAGAVARNRDCLLVGGCDLDIEKCKLFTKRWKCPHTYLDIEEMLAETHPDILHIATPPETHLKIIERTLAYEVKGIICEKPLAENSQEALKIAKIYSSGRLQILTNHERRYSKDYQIVKKHVMDHTYGDLLSIYARLYMGQNMPVDDILLHDGTHMIDIIQFLISVSLKKLKIEKLKSQNQEILIIISRADRIPVILEIGSGRNHIAFELDLSFSSGRIRIGNGLYEEYDSGKSPYYEKMNSLIKNAARRPRITGYFTNMLKDAVLCARNPARIPLSSAQDGYTALSFIDSVKDTEQSDLQG
ncbi:Inositol 2-dehydrogenase/D-chiro-inositol 3-dehydrogenase [subsurface metagenome]